MLSYVSRTTSNETISINSSNVQKLYQFKEDSLQLYLLVEVTYGTIVILHFAKDLP